MLQIPPKTLNFGAFMIPPAPGTSSQEPKIEYFEITTPKLDPQWWDAAHRYAHDYHGMLMAASDVLWADEPTSHFMYARLNGWGGRGIFGGI